MGLRSTADEMGDKELVEALCDIERGLRDRDIDFVEGLAARLKREGAVALSPAQRKWAADIWERCGDG